MKTFHRIRTAISMLNPPAFRIKAQPCEACNNPILVKFDDNEHMVRCIRCGANPINMSVIAAIKAHAPNLESSMVYELSFKGPLFEYLNKNTGQLSYSEYLDNVEPGEYIDGIQCQNVEHLTFPDDSFDLCTSVDVFEHVADDVRGFSEILRVLKPKGLFIFTVPMHENPETVERATIENGKLRYLLPPEYHDDPLRGANSALVFRDYGRDVSQRLKAQGFSTVDLVPHDQSAWWGFGRSVVVAAK